MKLKLFRRKKAPVTTATELFTPQQVEGMLKEYGDLRYNEGKNDGIAIARQLATKTLKESLWQQNQNHSQTTKPTQSYFGTKR